MSREVEWSHYTVHGKPYSLVVPQCEGCARMVKEAITEMGFNTCIGWIDPAFMWRKAGGCPHWVGDGELSAQELKTRYPVDDYEISPIWKMHGLVRYTSGAGQVLNWG